MECDKITREIWDFCESKALWLVATHIPGSENVEADFCSRNFTDDTEWSLNDDIFEIICERWGVPSIDLFASRLNHKLDRFVSWHHDPEAWFVNAFTMFWGDFQLIYVFPPFRLVGRVIRKIRADKANAILVAPRWPGHFWYGMISSKHARDLLTFDKNQDNLLTDAPHLQECFIKNIPLIVARFWNGH